MKQATAHPVAESLREPQKKNNKMKSSKLFAAIITLGLCALPAGHVRADITEFLTLNVTTFQQNSNRDDGIFTTTPVPTIKTHSTAEILKRLAADKFAQGNWPSNSFPASAKLAVIPTVTNQFVVITGTNILVDVSDILSFQNGDDEIASGKKRDATGLAAPTISKRQIGRVTFDDTNAGNPNGGLKFYLQGVLLQTTTDSTPANGFYMETHMAILTSAAGEGSSNPGTANEKRFICTGTLTATGKARLHL